MKKLYKLVKNCDFYGVDVSLNYRQKKAYKSFYGITINNKVAITYPKFMVSNCELAFYICDEDISNFPEINILHGEVILGSMNIVMDEHIEFKTVDSDGLVTKFLVSYEM